MRYLTFAPKSTQTFKVCFLVPKINRDEILKHYIKPFSIDPNEVLVLDVHHSQVKKNTPVAEQKAWIEEELSQVLIDCQVEYLLVTDPSYFKILAKVSKAEANLGYVLDSDFGPEKVIYVPNFQAIFYDPDNVRAKIARGMNALLEHRSGQHQAPGYDIIHYAEYPTDPAEIEAWLEQLLKARRPLTCDIEAFSFKHHDAGIGTISFAWSRHEGIAFPVDLSSDPQRVRKALLRFFIKFTNKIIYHSIHYDAYILIYQLFMKDLLDTEGMLTGLNIMLRNWDCTRLITYLATNSCAGNHLSLKIQSQEFSGNYSLGDELKDIRNIPLPDLLRYNLIDALSTWFVKEKHWDTMVNDQQLPIYENLFKPCMWDIIQMQLTGMPVNIERAKEVNTILAAEEATARSLIMQSEIIQEFTHDILNVEHARKRNAKLKKKQILPGDEPQEFNPNSDPQMRALLFDFLELPVISLTESKLPSTDGETIEALLNRTTDPKLKQLLEALQLFAIIGTLTSNFMPSILGAVEAPDGWHYLFGSFNLGGALSGRLSSSGPNLQNIPSTGKGHKIKLKYAKLIKSCFEAPPGWLFIAIDFESLEDKISALTTKDPNKLKVYTDGYDGHSLRAYAYWPSKMPDIDPNSVDSINSIAKKYKPLRDRSKNPTFTLTYQGTKHALMKKYGFTEIEAIEIENKYHDLYKVSDDWVNARLDAAMTDGYITVAFGLRLRTPLLKQVVRGTSKTPYEAEAEGRTAGNAMGQSYCMLNSRAHMEFMQKVRASGHRLAIRHCAQIHDAGYYMIQDDVTLLLYANEHLVKAVQWQEDPLIQHDEVKLGGKLSIFHPHWGSEITIPNAASKDEIFALIAEAIDALSTTKA